jgi:multiple sugar transport system ATP-binding protein
MNFINGWLEKKGNDVFFCFEGNEIKLPADKANNPALNDYIDQEVIAGIRPEAIFDNTDDSLSRYSESVIKTYVEVTELMGAEIYLYLVVGETNMIARVPSNSVSRAGDDIEVAFDVSKMHLFDKDTERCILH